MYFFFFFFRKRWTVENTKTTQSFAADIRLMSQIVTNTTHRITRSLPWQENSRCNAWQWAIVPYHVLSYLTNHICPCPAGCVWDEIRQDARWTRRAVLAQCGVSHGSGEQEHRQQREQCRLFQLQLRLGGGTGHSAGWAAGTGEWQTGGCHHLRTKIQTKGGETGRGHIHSPSHSPPACVRVIWTFLFFLNVSVFCNVLETSAHFSPGLNG